MVKAAANHPSVIMYGLLNESASDDPKCRPAYERLVGRFRETDPDRLVTYASSQPFEDICFDLADVISVNSYPGWYDGEVADITARLAAIADSVDSRGLADRPLLLSEVGAGAIPGWRDWNRGLWSEEYQADVLDAVLEYVLSAGDRWCGVALWQFCDCRSSADRSRALFRPRSYNNKGIVDEYRRPKLAYDIVRRRFRAANR
jgi:beta-glucuronidase